MRILLPVLFLLPLLAQKAPELPDPLAPHALAFLGEATAPWQTQAARLMGEGKHREAAAWLLKVLQRKPDDLRCLLALGECYAALRRPDLWAQATEAALRAGLQDLAAPLESPWARRLSETPEYQRLKSTLARLRRSWGTLRHAEQSRPLPFRFFAPEGADLERPLPLVIALHGRGGVAENLAPIWETFQRPAFLLAVPEAPYALQGAGLSPGPQMSWDYPSRDKALWERADPQIGAYLRKVVAEVRKTHAVGDVFLLGHSQGGAYAYLTALERPGEFRGVVVFGSIHPGPHLKPGQLEAGAGKVALFIAHGRQDAAAPIARAEAAATDFRKAGYAVTWHPFEGGHDLPEAALREAQRWIEAQRTSVR